MAIWQLGNCLSSWVIGLSDYSYGEGGVPPFGHSFPSNTSYTFSSFKWRDTGKILKKPEEVAKSGDFSTAQALALKAKRQGELAVAQTKSQQNAGSL